jgi:uncharacterized protein (UPF0335 family)
MSNYSLLDDLHSRIRVLEKRLEMESRTLFPPGKAFSYLEMIETQAQEIVRLGNIIKDAYRELKVDGPNTNAVNNILLRYYDGRKP